jgi:hypothetical protein
MRRLIVFGAVVGVFVALVAAPAGAAKLFRDSGTFGFSGQDEEATEECGFPVDLDLEGRFNVLGRLTKDGEVLITDHSVFHATFTNTDNGKTAKANGGSTDHVVIGAGTDGRDVVKITGLQGHVVAPGFASARAQDSGQLVIEAFGPEDPDPLFVSARGLFEGMGGPLPELCEALA